MFKAVVAGLFFACALVVGPVAVSAADAPVESATPLPEEKFIVVSGAPAGTVYNELSPGNTTGGFGVRGAIEVPALGHNWMAQVDYHSFNYQHRALGLLPNGITFACPTGDQGCVTPVGYKTYNAALVPGPTQYLNAFNAQDTFTLVGAGLKIANPGRFYVGVGFGFRGFNYLNYPGESSFGAGIDKLPDLDRAFSVYGSFWAMFNMHGTYTGPTAASLGTLSGATFNLNYRMYTYRVGATYRFAKTPLFVDVSDVGDRADTGANGPSDATHNALFLGVGAAF